jgi:hypothetical protein
MSYEAWCPRCRVTHPPERKTCVHCGGRVVQSRGEAELERRLSPPLGRGEAPGEGGGAPPEETPQAQAMRPLRIGLALLWLVLAIAGSLWQQCGRGS